MQEDNESVYVSAEVRSPDDFHEILTSMSTQKLCIKKLTKEDFAEIPSTKALIWLCSKEQAEKDEATPR